MKKFNIDELIWFIILVLLSLSLVFLIRSGKITNFVGSDMIIYFYLSIIILSVFAIFQFGRIFTIKRRVETTNKYIPLTFTLCVGVVLLYVFPLLKGNTDINEELLLKNNADAIIINSENYSIEKIPVNYLNISSTNIRNSFKENKNPKYYLREKVFEYIKRVGLYV